LLARDPKARGHPFLTVRKSHHPMELSFEILVWAFQLATYFVNVEQGQGAEHALS
jgi:hypothetical protein